MAFLIEIKIAGNHPGPTRNDQPARIAD